MAGYPVGGAQAHWRGALNLRDVIARAEAEFDARCRFRLGLALVAEWRGMGPPEPGDPAAFAAWVLEGERDARQRAAARFVMPHCFAEGARLDAAMALLGVPSEPALVP